MRIHILALDEVFDTGLSTILDTLSVANDLAGANSTFSTHFEITIIGTRRHVRTSQGLSVPVATEINLFDPDYVILGGGVLQMQDFPMELLLETIGRHTRKPLPYDNLQIIISSQNQES